MGRGHRSLGRWCLLLLVVAACKGPLDLRAETTPIQTGSSRETPSPSAAAPAESPSIQAVEEVLLREIAAGLCPYPDSADRIDPYERYFTVQDPVYIFTCYPAAGHSITVIMRRFVDPAGARAEFEAAAAPGTRLEIQGFPASDWEEQHPSFPDGRFEYRVRLMQVGPWLIELRSFDDTHYISTPDPRQAALTVLQVFQEHDLPVPP